MAVVWLDENHTRLQVASVGLSMKQVCCYLVCLLFAMSRPLLTGWQGKYLANHNLSSARICREFKCVPVLETKSDVPYNIDGDPVVPAAMHAAILQRRLRVYCTPLDQRKAAVG